MSSPEIERRRLRADQLRVITDELRPKLGNPALWHPPWHAARVT